MNIINYYIYNTTITINSPFRTFSMVSGSASAPPVASMPPTPPSATPGGEWRMGHVN